MTEHLLASQIDVGESIPLDTAHAVSVSLPTWKANVGYEEGQDWVVSKMKTGYPRFFIHKLIQAFAADVLTRYGAPGEKIMLFPSRAVASRCLDFYNRHASQPAARQGRIVDLLAVETKDMPEEMKLACPRVSAFLFPEDQFPVAKQYWQHSGEGISSRHAAYCHELFKAGFLVEASKVEEARRPCKGPRRYRRTTSISLTAAPKADSAAVAEPNGEAEELDYDRFIEERFGRNLDMKLASNAKLAVRRRIAGSLTANVELSSALQQVQDEMHARQVAGLSEDDVYLFPTGMNAIFTTHRSLLAVRGGMKSIEFGFPYVDTLKILEKFGPGCRFFGFGESHELDELEKLLEGGERYLALFCEFPGNPLLKTPDLARIRQLADKYDFAVVVDETLGNFLNVNVLQYADVAVTSLTKLFSGSANVMGGSATLNPHGRYYADLKRFWSQTYEDNYWAEDAVFLERNSRDFIIRNEKINTNAEAICEVLRSHPRVKQVNYPKYHPTREFYDHCRLPNGGYGGLLSATFQNREDAIIFYDVLETAKGPSLGTNFTLSSPFVILAHYTELDWAAHYGVEADLIRFSVGLEDTRELVATFRRALSAISCER
ncbi:PLP-dependent transferase [Trichodelitschia bisporula]|uniref:cystathionine gamma-synthase n=1 Tax=Trichodelitschia bisporula TaxID=703511 RepID=A0A6G1HVU4_9PEZI|nr:PLP-dependent transferase [Trichodelitschia bisporula]